MATLALMLFAAMFLVVFVLRSVIQKRRTGDAGLRTGGLRAPMASLEWFAGWLLVLAIVTAVAGPVAELNGLSPFTNATVVRGVGMALAVIGLVLTFASQLSMGDDWRIGVDESEETSLVTTGAFGLVRNPIFSCMIVFAAGLTMMVPNVISIAGFIALVVAIEMQVRYVEEPFLNRLHGATYRDYAAAVGRLTPGLGQLRR